MITVTPNAAKEVKRLMDKEQKPNLALRIGVKGGGCSGMSYVLNIDDASPKEHDAEFEQEGIKILIDAKSQLYLVGTTIDYDLDILNGGFKFENPQAKKSCGCGSSFTA